MIGRNVQNLFITLILISSVSWEIYVAQVVSDYDRDDPAILSNINARIAIYQSSPRFKMVSSNELQKPITELGVINVIFNDGTQGKVPAFVKATLRQEYLKKSSERSISKDVDEQMERMNLTKGDDDRGHLLSNTLGGNGEIRNIVPMAKDINRHLCGGDKEKKPILNEFGNALSRWRNDEHCMQRFLEGDKDRRIEWTLAVIYEKAVLDSDYPGQRNFRPTHFIVQFILFNPDGNMTDHTGEILYTNIKGSYCPWAEYRDYHNPQQSYCRNLRN